jgi:Glycosyltransferase family 87
MFFVVAVCVAALRVGVLTQVGNLRLGASWAMTDFDSGVYYPIQAVLSGENPYDRERFLSLYPVGDGFPPYPPAILLLHLPFGVLSVKTAHALYAGFTLGLTVILAWLALRMTRNRATVAAVLTLGAVLLVSRPGHWNLLLGQRAALLAVGSYLALFYADRLPWVSGAGLALATLKPTWGIPLATLMLARGNIRPVILGAVISALVNLPLLLLIAGRAGGLLAFQDRLLKGYREWQGTGDVSPASSTDRIDAATLISRFLGHPLSDGGQLGLAVSVIVLATIAVRVLKRDRAAGAQDLTIGVICTAVLLCGHHVGYDFLLLTIPMLAVIFRGLPAVAHKWETWVFICLFSVPTLNWVSTQSVLAALRPSGGLWLLVASLNSAALVCLFCGYLGLTARWRIARAGVSPPYPAREPYRLDSVDQRV